MQSESTVRETGWYSCKVTPNIIKSLLRKYLFFALSRQIIKVNKMVRQSALLNELVADMINSDNYMLKSRHCTEVLIPISMNRIMQEIQHKQHIQCESQKLLP